MADVWYLIMVTPTAGTFIWPMPADEGLWQAAIDAAKAAKGYPAEDFPAGWDLSLTQGEPAPSMLSRSDVTLYDSPPA